MPTLTPILTKAQERKTVKNGPQVSRKYYIYRMDKIKQVNYKLDRYISGPPDDTEYTYAILVFTVLVLYIAV